MLDGVNMSHNNAAPSGERNRVSMGELEFERRPLRGFVHFRIGADQRDLRLSFGSDPTEGD
jgi:hypothetical protein